jgi:hypothetical protein
MIALIAIRRRDVEDPCLFSGRGKYTQGKVSTHFEAWGRSIFHGAVDALLGLVFHLLGRIGQSFHEGHHPLAMPKAIWYDL